MPAPPLTALPARAVAAAADAVAVASSLLPWMARTRRLRPQATRLPRKENPPQGHPPCCGKGEGQARGQGQGQGQAGTKAAGPRPPREVHPLLHKLAELHPKLFGARFRPLKLGTYEDLLARHPGVLDAEGLKAAIAQHARSTRYLESMAIGDRRHDLDGHPVDDVSADHRFHAIMEIHRRQQGRDASKDRRPQLLQRIVAAVRDSGLDREGYLAQIRTSDPAALALVHEAFDTVGAEIAKREALRRAFEASGQTPEAFAQMYGMSLGQVKQALKKA